MDPYGKPPVPPIPAAGWSPPSGNFTFPAQPVEPRNMAYQMSPEELDQLIAQGFTIGEDGSMRPPLPPGGGPLAGPVGPPPPEMATEASMWDNPIFAAHMAIRNPQPPPSDPITEMQRRQRQFLRGDQGPNGPNVAVPGGASIVGGMPQAAPTPSAQYSQMDQAQPQGRRPMLPGDLRSRRGGY